MVASWVLMMLLPRSKIAASDNESLDNASWMIGTVEASYARMKGGVAPGGRLRKAVCDTPVIWEYDRTGSALGWKKYLTTEMPLSDCDSVCSMSLTVVCAVRSVKSTMWLAISRGCSPV